MIVLSHVDFDQIDGTAIPGPIPQADGDARPLPLNESDPIEYPSGLADLVDEMDPDGEICSDCGCPLDWDGSCGRCDDEEEGEL